MKLMKDLLYSRGNISLDISRLCAMLAVLSFIACLFWSMARGGEFDPIAVGSGFAALFAGCAGWIHFRQKQETGAEGPTDA